MTIAWYWGLINALLVTGVIYLNGHGRRVGWLAGMLAQAWIVTFGLLHGSVWFAFSVLPLGMFAYNWWRHPAREAEADRVRRAEVPGGILETSGPISDAQWRELKAKLTAACDARLGRLTPRQEPLLPQLPGLRHGDRNKANPPLDDAALERLAQLKDHSINFTGTYKGDTLPTFAEALASGEGTPTRPADQYGRSRIDAFDNTDLEALAQRAERIIKASQERQAAEERRQAQEREQEQ